MINVSPIGRNCSREERNEFEKFDKVRGQPLSDHNSVVTMLALLYWFLGGGRVPTCAETW